MRTILLTALVAVVLGFALGYVVNQSIMQVEINSLTAKIESKDGEISSLNSQLAQLRNEISRLTSDLESERESATSLQGTIDGYRLRLSSLENLVSNLTSTLSEEISRNTLFSSKLEELKKLLEDIKNDRILLSWIRTNPPGTREGDREYWNETRALAADSDPSLAFSVDRILANLDLYYDWQERFPNPAGNTRQDFIDWCPLFVDWLFEQPAGVDQYGAAIEDFREEVFLVIISHLDGLTRILES
jgi:peptidoglycan hydrolase CwlO-like protein